MVPLEGGNPDFWGVGFMACGVCVGLVSTWKYASAISIARPSAIVAWLRSIAPGAIPGGGFSADPATLIDKIALGRVGTPEDVGNAAIALLSNRFSAYVTGTTLVVDGGLALFNWIAPTNN